MKRVLLVDDSAEIRLIVRMCLHGSQYHLDETEDSKTALDRIDRQSYDAILMDIELGDAKGDGKDLARTIRKLGGRWAVVPILALTGNTDPEDVKKCLDAGCTRHIAKPVKKDLILGALDELVAASSAIGVPLPDSAMGPAIDPAVLEMGPQYLEKRKRDLTPCRAALSEGNFAELRRVGHNLKGTAPTYGFPSLGAIGAKIEAAAKAGDAQQLAPLLQELDEEVHSLLSERMG